MRHVFGPVASRRLGRSLGVDPVPFKTCHWNCVYCQLGRTAPLRPERRDYLPTEDVLAELRAALASHPRGSIDWVTFGGSGEPTLHAGLGRMIREAKALSDVPVAVLTSGALLHRAEVREDLLAADAVLPSLDAGSESVYRAVNRPWPGLTFTKMVDGLVAFRAAYRGRLWVEVMLVRGLNDAPEALADIAAVLKSVAPDRVFLNVPARPAAEAWARPPNPETLRLAAAVLGADATEGHTPPDDSDELIAGGPEALVELIARHPLEEHDVRRSVARWGAGAVEAAMAALPATGRVRRVERSGRFFWVPAAGRYA